MTALSLDGKRLREDLLSTDTLDLVPRLSLILVLPRHAEGVLLVLAVLVFTAILIERRLYRNPFVWLLIALVRGIDQYLHWHGVDDHLVLITYWCLALSLAFFSSRPRRVLSLSGRLLVGLVMFFATVWKLLSPEYLDGRFFHFTLLVDPRFEAMAKWVGGIPAEVYTDNLRSYVAVRSGEVASAPISAPARITPLAWLLTVGTVAMEGALAALFLWPWNRERLRTGLAVGILSFCVLTYGMVPVVMFGGILVAMTMAACDGEPRAQRWLLAGFGLLIVWTPIWRAIVSLA